MRLALAALSIVYASSSTEADEHCEQSLSVDSDALLQVGSSRYGDPQSEPSQRKVLPDTVLSTILDEALAPKDEHSHGIFHYGMWGRIHWGEKHLRKVWDPQHVLKSAKGFDWTCLAIAFALAFILRWVWLWQDDDRQVKPHLASMGVWLLLACVMGAAIWRRFGEGAGQQWAAGYIFELFFMLENVFVFQYVIRAAGLPRRLVSQILDRVVWAQILFEAVFFLGLAHQLQSMNFLPPVLGIGLTAFGVSTLIETIKKTESKTEKVIGSALKTVASVTSHSSVEGENEDGLVTFNDHRLQLTAAGSVWILLLVVDFLCEIDTVLTKIEEIPNPFISFSSSCMAAFSLPELFLLSQDLLFHFPLVKCGIGVILCLLGLQLILARLVVIEPLVTCGAMVSIILAFILLSLVVENEQKSEAPVEAPEVEIKQPSIDDLEAES